MTTQTRPTPEELAIDVPDGYAAHIKRSRMDMLADLARHGYVSVHPDDVPDSRFPGSPHSPDYETNAEVDAWDEGWNACRAHIFGETAETA